MEVVRTEARHLGTLISKKDLFRIRLHPGKPSTPFLLGLLLYGLRKSQPYNQMHIKENFSLFFFWRDDGVASLWIRLSSRHFDDANKEVG